MDSGTEQNQLYLLSRGDPKAFKLLFMHYFPRVKGFIQSLVGDEAETEDLAQDIFVKIWQNRSSMEQVQNLNAYVYRMARNAVFSHFEHEALHTNYIAAQQNQQTSPTQDELEELLFAKELEATINLSVQKMPPQRKLIYELSRIEGCTNEEISQRLSISKRTVEAHISTALADIRKVIGVLLLFF